jgi:O-antigen ligase
MEKISIDKISFYLLYLLIPSIIFSNALANILLVVLGFFSCYLIFKKQIQIPSWLIYFFILVLYYFLHPTNFLIEWNHLDYKNLIKILFLIRFPLLVILILYLAKKEINVKYFKIIFIILSLLLFLLSIDIIFQFIFKVDIFGIKPGQWDDNINDFKRYSGFFGDELIGGAYLYLNSFLILYFLINKNLQNKRNFFLILIFLILISVILSGERVALFKYLLLITIFIFFIIPDFKKQKFILIFTFFLLGILIYNNETLKKRYIQGTFNEIGSVEKIKNNSYHYLHYVTAINIFKDNVLFGAGYKSFPLECKKYDEQYYDLEKRKAITSCSTHPHNMIFQILSSGGIIGFIIFLLFLSKLILFLSNSKNYLLITYVLVFYLPIIPSGSIFTSWINFNFWLILGLSLVYEKLKINKKDLL